MPDTKAPRVREEQPEPAGAEQSLLSRRLDLTRVETQVWIFLLVLVVAALLRFWDLGSRAFHHDEALHALFSWRFYTGEATYEYQPAFHGPFLYHLTALFYFLFGASDAIARAPEALFGLLLVGLCYPLRRWLGRWGWLIAAMLLALSPAFTYFSRFARQDALVATLTLGTAFFLWRYLEEQRPRDLLLAGAAAALAFASHEEFLIAAFTFLSFLGLAYLLEFQGQRFRGEGRIVAGTVLLVAILLEVRLATWEVAPLLQALLVALGLLALGYLGMSLFWPVQAKDPSPVQRAARALAANPRTVLAALGVFGIIVGLLFTNFLTYPRGFVDGLYRGIEYWLGQQPAHRGDQPWFYYPMLLSVYEPIVLTAGIAGSVVALIRARRRARAVALARGKDQPEAERPLSVEALFPLFLAYWALSSLILYTWAGEKMPWLLLQVALPWALLAGLALDRLVAWVSWQGLWRSGDWSVAPLFFLLALVLRGLVALYQDKVPHPLAGQYLQLQIAVLAVIALGVIALLVWRIYRSEGKHLAQSFATLGLVFLTVYTVRSAFLLNFYNGDNSVEMLVYTQTAPDVPLVVQQVERLGIDQTRKVRTLQDPTGGHGLRIAIDTSRDAGLEWPFDWYLRDFARAGNLSHFDGTQVPPPDSDVLLILADNEAHFRPYLQGTYTGWRLKHRWWFPEAGTYKRWTLLRKEATPAGFETMPWLRPSTYNPEGVISLWDYLILRQLPSTLQTLQGQDFYLYIRSDLLPAGGAAVPPDPYIEKLTTRQAIQQLGTPGSGPGQLNLPRGIALDEAGNLYIADSGNHRIVRFDVQGQAISWGGNCALGGGDPCLGKFNEPWGVAVDKEGRVYVADTWNHRIQVFDTTGQFLGQWGEGTLVDAETDPRGREGAPFGLYGPRGVAVDNQGHVYVTDTGNERVLVYTIRVDANGQVQADYLDQWGTTGPADGQFVEPVGIAVDTAGRVYVADTLNARIQVFAPDENGKVQHHPVVTWKVTGWDSLSRENKPYIAVSQGGQVYFPVPERSYVAVTDQAGKILEVWGRSGSDLESFIMPIGVAVDARGRLYVSDSGNGRVLIFAVP